MLHASDPPDAQDEVSVAWAHVARCGAGYVTQRLWLHEAGAGLCIGFIGICPRKLSRPKTLVPMVPTELGYLGIRTKQKGLSGHHLLHTSLALRP